MPSLIKTLALKFLSKTSSENPFKVKSDIGENSRMADIAIDIGSFRLTLKDVATNEEAIARIEEFLKGQSLSAPTDYDPRSGNWEGPLHAQRRQTG